MRKVIGAFILFFIVFLSYSPLAIEVDSIHANATTTNAITGFLDSWFGLVWAILGTVCLSLTLYFAYHELS